MRRPVPTLRPLDRKFKLAEVVRLPVRYRDPEDEPDIGPERMDGTLITVAFGARRRSETVKRRGSTSREIQEVRLQEERRGR